MFGKTILATLGVAAIASVASATTVTRVTHSTTADGLAASISDSDLIEGNLGVEVEELFGGAPAGNWHPANSTPEPKEAVFTNGVVDLGVDGLVNDFPPAGDPTKVMQYDLGGSFDVGAINIYSGNENPDGRIFNTFRIQLSTDGGTNFTDIQGLTPSTGLNNSGYFESNNLGVVNKSGNSFFGDTTPARATLVEVGDSSNLLATGVTDVRVWIFANNNTDGQYVDPFDGVNTYTGVDDGFDAANSSPLIWEIDVIEGEVVIPEPGTIVLMGLGLGFVATRRRRASS